MLSIGYTNQVSRISGNIEQFASMNGRSFINNISHDVDNQMYSLSFIQYPANISFGELLYLEKYKHYFIQSKLSTINYGTLIEEQEEFNASDYMIEISIIKKYLNNLIVGSSIGYTKSHIADYINSQVIHDIGFSYSYFNQLIILGFSIENMTHIIDEYSNINSSHSYYSNFSCQFNPRYINSSLFINYISSKNDYSELIMSFQGRMNNKLHIFMGKSFKFLNNSFDTTYSFYDNISFGVGTELSKYKFNFGLQYIGDMGLVFGSSLSFYSK